MQRCEAVRAIVMPNACCRSGRCMIEAIAGTGSLRRCAPFSANRDGRCRKHRALRPYQSWRKAHRGSGRACHEVKEPVMLAFVRICHGRAHARLSHGRITDCLSFTAPPGARQLQISRRSRRRDHPHAPGNADRLRDALAAVSTTPRLLCLAKSGREVMADSNAASAQEAGRHARGRCPGCSGLRRVGS